METLYQLTLFIQFIWYIYFSMKFYQVRKIKNNAQGLFSSECHTFDQSHLNTDLNRKALNCIVNQTVNFLHAALQYIYLKIY